MTKKTNNIFFPMIVIAMIGLFMASCDREDYTGYSTLNVKSPTISISPAFTSPVTLTEDGSKHQFTVTLSEIQSVDVKLYIKQIDGTAGPDDYTVTGSIVIPTGKTSGTGEIQILSDELKEETETLIIQIGDETTANASLTPITVTFNINNLTADDLVVGLSWETDVADATGLDLDPTEAVDLRLLLIDGDGEIVGEADGASFEELTLASGDLDDGEYRLATDIYSTINAGDYNAPITLDLELVFNQVGLINDTILAFPAVMTNELSCDLYRTILATVTKSGSTYTIEKAISFTAPNNSDLAGTWTGTDAEYPSQVVTEMNDGVLGIVGLNFGWMLDFWGETVVDSSYVEVVVNWCEGKITIPEQDYITTLYNGEEYPYTISGSGTFDTSGEFPTMTVNYEVFQDGFSPSGWSYDNGYQNEPYFIAVLTMDPAGLKSAKILKSAKVVKPNFVKPKR